MKKSKMGRISSATRKVVDAKLKLKRAKLQEKFSHYLRSTRLDSNNNELELSQVMLASVLGCAPSLITRLESSYPYPRVYKSVEYLEKFARLQNLSLADFCSILEGSRIEEKSNWHNALFDRLTKLSSFKNLISLQKVLLKYEDDSEGFNNLLKMMFSISKMGTGDLSVVETFIQRLGGNKE